MDKFAPTGIGVIESTPEGMRAIGYKVKFTHLRRYVPGPARTVWLTVGAAKHDPPDVAEMVLAATGGVTWCRIFNESGVLLVEAPAVCADMDTYNKQTGRIKAFGRAYAELLRALAATKLGDPVRPMRDAMSGIGGSHVHGELPRNVAVGDSDESRVH